MTVIIDLCSYMYNMKLIEIHVKHSNKAYGRVAPFLVICKF